MSVSRIAVLNPGGNDPDQSFFDGAGLPNANLHAPVNYHAYAACCRGKFLRSYGHTEGLPTILLLTRHLARGLQILRKLKSQKQSVAIALKEAGSHQITNLLHSPKHLMLFQIIIREADGAIASTPELVPLFESTGAKKVSFIPTPYPVEETAWDFSVLPEQRRGIFIGTREFSISSRRHLAALLAAKTLSQKTNEPVTVINLEGRTGRAMLAALHFPSDKLRIIEKRMPYPDYLKLVARHRLIWQLDRSRVPGQVAGDALLCRIPCIGGDGAIDRIAFPDFHGLGREDAELLDCAEELLLDDRQYKDSLAKIQAIPSLTFSNVRQKLISFFE